MYSGFDDRLFKCSKVQHAGLSNIEHTSIVTPAVCLASTNCIARKTLLCAFVHSCCNTAVAAAPLLLMFIFRCRGGTCPSLRMCRRRLGRPCSAWVRSCPSVAHGRRGMYICGTLSHTWATA